MAPRILHEKHKLTCVYVYVTLYITCIYICTLYIVCTCIHIPSASRSVSDGACMTVERERERERERETGRWEGALESLNEPLLEWVN